MEVRHSRFDRNHGMAEWQNSCTSQDKIIIAYQGFIILGMGSGNVQPVSQVQNPQIIMKLPSIVTNSPEQFSQGLNKLKNILSMAPTTEVFEKMGEMMNKIGLFEQAKNYFQKALEDDPNNPSYLRKMGQVLFSQGKYQEAKNFLQNALNTNSQQLETWNLLLISLCRAGLNQQAVSLLNQVQRKIQQNKISFQGKSSIPQIVLANFYNNSANAYRYNGNMQQAIQLYEKAIALNGQNSLFYVNCAIAYAHEDVQNYNKAYEYLVISEELILSGKSTQYNSYVLMQIRDFKQQIEQWNFKRAHNFASKQERKSLSQRMTSLENKIVQLFQPDLSDPDFDYPQTNALDDRLDPITVAWASTQFDASSLFEIDQQIYKLYEENHSNFALIPFQLVIFCLKQLRKGKKISDIDALIGDIVAKLADKYPPSKATDEKKSVISVKSFQVGIQEQPNLFEHKFFKSYENLMNQILGVSKKAKKVFPQFDGFVRQICLAKGYGFKSGLKFPENADEVSESKIIIRVCEKLFKQLKTKKNQLLQKLTVALALEQKINARIITINFLRCWKQIISEILVTRIKNKQETKFRIYDFVRAKCMYKTAEDIEETAKMVIRQCQKRGYRIIQCDNRIQKGTKDFVFKFEVGPIVGELQLALQFDSTLNEFNHGIYEIKRSPGGSIFGCLLWMGKLGQISLIKDMKRMHLEVKDIPPQNKQKFLLKQSLEYVLKQIQQLK